ncbi:MAG: hypothetical protein ACO3FI_11530 [Cyclobacteriaceae bacterium]
MTSQSPFLEFFYNIIIIASVLSLAAAFLIFLIHKTRIGLLKTAKEKYDFLRTNESKTYKRVWYMVSATGGLLVNLYGMGKGNLTEVGVWFFVRLFFGFAAATIIGYVAHLVIEYYFPTILNRRLNKWRYMPRINPRTGNPMRLLTEEQEDVHLDQGMQAEENIFSIDYDVWMDDQTNDVQIEKYPGHLTALRCNNCTFHTMKISREEVIATKEDGTPLELLRHYQCSYCKSVRATQFHVSKNEAEDYRNFKMSSRAFYGPVELVKVEIVSAAEGKKSWEFRSPDQAAAFLKDYGSKN